VLKARAEQPELCASLLNIIQFETVSEASLKAAADAGITLRSFADVIAIVRGGCCARAIAPLPPPPPALSAPPAPPPSAPPALPPSPRHARAC
jgi:hypothetical protein